MAKDKSKKKPVIILKSNKLLTKKKRTSRSEGLAAISTINTAPVAIGNSITGHASKEYHTSTGVRVVGRDFMFQAQPTAVGNNGWTVVGGVPLTPAAFVDSCISAYARMYAKFRFRQVIVHYITSSSTASTGDVVLYYQKDRASVMLNTSSNNLLAMVLSDDSTVLGPQWLNHSVKLQMDGKSWKYVDYGMHTGVNDYSTGDLFLLSKTVTTDSPGYVLFDFDIEFSERQIQPRLLTFPMQRIFWWPVCLSRTNVAVSTNDVAYLKCDEGNGINGIVNPVPTGSLEGDVFKIFFDLTNSLAKSGNPAAWTNCTAANLLKINFGGNNQNLTIQDGMTMYAMYLGGESWYLYTNPEGPFSGANPDICWQVQATVTFTLCGWVSYIGSVNSTELVPNF